MGIYNLKQGYEYIYINETTTKNVYKIGYGDFFSIESCVRSTINILTGEKMIEIRKVKDIIEMKKINFESNNWLTDPNQRALMDSMQFGNYLFLLIKQSGVVELINNFKEQCIQIFNYEYLIEFLVKHLNGKRLNEKEIKTINKKWGYANK